MEAALARIDGSAMSYDEWLAVGMALHDWDPGGLDLWIAWSRRSARHDPGYEPAMAAKWGSFRAGGGVTIGTVLGLGR